MEMSLIYLIETAGYFSNCCSVTCVIPMRFLSLFLALLSIQLCAAVLPEYSDIYVPDNCDSFAQPGDHVLVEFEIFYSNGTVAQHVKRPDQLVHFVVQEGVVSSSVRSVCILSMYH